MWFCPNCGTLIEDWVDVCSNCGYSDRGLDDVELAEVED